MYSVLFKSTYINTSVQNESISGICAVPTMPSNARSGCCTHEMGGVRWQLGPIKYCGVDVGHWDIAPMGWEVEVQRPLACCTSIGRCWMEVGAWWAMVGVGSRMLCPFDARGAWWACALALSIAPGRFGR